MVPKVSLRLRVRQNGRRKFLKPLLPSNGRCGKVPQALVNGSSEPFPTGVYYLRYTDPATGKRKPEAVGGDLAIALDRKRQRERELAYKKAAKAAGVLLPVENDKSRTKLSDALENFLSRVQLHRSPKTSAEFSYLLDQFREHCPKDYLDQITKDDLLGFVLGLRKQGLAERTVTNKINRVLCFLKSEGITGLLAPNERPRFDEKVAEAYTEEEIKALFAASPKDEKLIWRFFLGSGGREAEVAHATWRDVSFSDKTFTVHSKRRQGFGPKDKAERRVPLPDTLVAALQGSRARQDSIYLFPNKDGKPHGHFLRLLKKRALEAGLNCGECVSRKGKSCHTRPVCRRWTLHAFRRTFATLHHEAGVSARTLQAWLGHSDLETTLRYLAVADMRSERTREMVNASFAGLEG